MNEMVSATFGPSQPWDWSMKWNGISLLPGGLNHTSAKYQNLWRFDFSGLTGVTGDREAC
jgi:hypothetical protein